MKKFYSRGVRMRQTVLTAAVFIFMIFFGFTSAHADYTYATLDVPGASNTHAFDVSGSNIVGGYYDAQGGWHGFVYNGTSYTTLNVPSAPNSTAAYGISGSNIVGVYGLGNGDHGFVYNGTSYTTLDVPGASGTWASRHKRTQHCGRV